MNEDDLIYTCHYCGLTCNQQYEFLNHTERCRMRFTKQARTYEDDNPWGFNKPLARAIIYLAELKKPDKGVSEDIDDLVKSAYHFLGEDCPHATLMLTPDQAQNGLEEILDD